MSCKLSDGTYIQQSTIEYRIRKTKKKLLDNQFNEYGYNFCATCKRNDCKPIDCAHIVSVKKCKELGQSELAYDINNFVIEGRKCHQKRDKLFLFSE